MLDIRSKDLNLLVLFETLMLERNVTQAAKRLHLSQSTLSYGLSRLRDMFSDDLFVRTGRGVTPTPKATDLAPRVSELLQLANRLFTEDAPFDVSKAEGTLRIASTEMVEHILLPKLIPLLRREAPGMTLQSTSTQGFLPKNALERGELDLAIAGFFGDLPEGFYRQELFSDTFRGIARKGHPIFSTKVTLKDFTAWDHILISPQGDMKSLIDESLSKGSKSSKGSKVTSGKNARRIVAGISNFLTPGWVVAESDVLLTAPSRLINVLEKTLPVQAFDLPFSSPKISVVQVWHERLHRDSLHRWIRGVLKSLLTQPTIRH
jgi:DNA-binding transcriptional LysR family regulator